MSNEGKARPYSHNESERLFSFDSYYGKYYFLYFLIEVISIDIYIYLLYFISNDFLHLYSLREKQDRLIQELQDRKFRLRVTIKNET